MSTDRNIRTSELVLLFLYAFFCLSIGGGLLPLLPVYATQLGATPSQIGVYMALTYAGLTASTLLTGRIVDRWQNRRLFALIVGLALMPALWWMAHVQAMWELTVATTLTWFFGGGCYALALIFAGMAAGPSERGKVFGVIATAMGAGGLVGGLVAGAIADRWGYSTLLTVFALYAILLAVTPLFIPAARRRPTATGPTEPTHDPVTQSTATGLGLAIYLLTVAALFGSIMSFVAILGRSLAMDAADFTASDIVLAAAIGSAVGILLPIWLGRLADRYSRTNLLICCYSCMALSLLLFAGAGALWHFWLASVFLAASNGAGGIVNAFVTDIAPRQRIGGALAYANAAQWVGAIIGFSGTGYIVETLSMQKAFLGFALLGPLAILVVLRIGWVHRRQVAIAETSL